MSLLNRVYICYLCSSVVIIHNYNVVIAVVFSMNHVFHDLTEIRTSFSGKWWCILFYFYFTGCVKGLCSNAQSLPDIVCTVWKYDIFEHCLISVQKRISATMSCFSRLDIIFLSFYNKRILLYIECGNSLSSQWVRLRKSSQAASEHKLNCTYYNGIYLWFDWLVDVTWFKKKPASGPMYIPHDVWWLLFQVIRMAINILVVHCVCKRVYKETMLPSSPLVYYTPSPVTRCIGQSQYKLWYSQVAVINPCRS